MISLSLWRLLEKLNEAPALRFDPRRCLRTNRKGATCRRCADNCPAGIITLSPPSPASPVSVDPEKCSGCGICAGICPTEAFALAGYSPGRLLGALQAGQKARFVCRKDSTAGGRALAGSAASTEATRLPSLGCLDETVLVGAAVLQGRVDLVVSDDRCATTCEFAPHCRRALELARSRAQAILDFLGVKAQIALAPADDPPTSPKRSGGSSRKEFLALLGRNALQAGAQLLPPLLVPGPSRSEEAPAPAVPVKRRVLLEIVGPFLAAHNRSWEPWQQEGATSDFFGQVDLSGQCDACGVCALVCPTGALSKLEAENGSLNLWHRPGYCLNCGTCARACPRRAIAVRPARNLPPTADAPVLAAGFEPGRCGACGGPLWQRRLSPPRSLCAQCQTRIDLINHLWPQGQK